MIELKVNFPVHIGEPCLGNEVEITATLTGDHTEDQPSVFIEVQGNEMMDDDSYQFTSQTAVILAVNSGYIIGIDDPEAIARIGKEITFMQVAYNTLRDMGNLM